MWSQVLQVTAQLAAPRTLAEQVLATVAESQLKASIGDDPNVTPQQIEDLARVQVPMMLALLVQQGMLREEGDRISTTASFDQAC